MIVVDNFYAQHADFEIDGHRGLYIAYLDTILPEGQMIEHDKNFYYVQNSEVHKCGTQKDYLDFRFWLESYDENDSWGPPD